MFVDASAMVAILLQEANGERLAAAIDAASSPLATNVIAVWETAAALHRKKNVPISIAEMRVLNFSPPPGSRRWTRRDELSLALAAFERYGRHRYPLPPIATRG